MSKYSDLIAAGYCVVSKRHGEVSRIDRPDWKEHMASTHPRGVELVKCLGDHEAADFYRRCISRDWVKVGAGHRSFPNSHDGPSKFLPKDVNK